MAKRVIQTGIGDLDKDLSLLFKFAEGEEHAALLDVIKDQAILPKNFLERIPKDLISLCLALASPTNFQFILQKSNKKSHEILHEAKRLVEKDFIGLLEHPTVLKILQEQNKEKKSPALNLNVISRVSAVPIWFGKPPMVPSVRIGLLDKRDKILLDTSLDWQDLAFLIRALTEILADQLDDGLSLFKKKFLDLPFKEKLAEDIQGIEKQLERLKKTAPNFGLTSIPADTSGRVLPVAKT